MPRDSGGDGCAARLAGWEERGRESVGMAAGVREGVEGFRVCVSFYMLEVLVGWYGPVWTGHLA